MIYVVIALVLTNIATLAIMMRARNLNSQLSQNQDSVKAWLDVHQSLQRATKSMVMITQVDPGSVFYRQPPRS